MFLRQWPPFFIFPPSLKANTDANKQISSVSKEQILNLFMINKILASF
jgi:hypothetical protein